MDYSIADFNAYQAKLDAYQTEIEAFETKLLDRVNEVLENIADFFGAAILNWYFSGGAIPFDEIDAGENVGICIKFEKSRTEADKTKKDLQLLQELTESFNSKYIFMSKENIVNELEKIVQITVKKEKKVEATKTVRSRSDLKLLKKLAKKCGKKVVDI